MDEVYDGDSPYIEYNGEAVEAIRWAYNGIVILPFGEYSIAILTSETDTVRCGVIDMWTRDLPGLIYGEWVSARKARFGE